MNERIKELIEKSGFLNKDEESIEYFAKLIIKDVIEILNDQKNYNKCTHTTFDLSQGHCVAEALITAIKERLQ